jgi:hypothetical protein
MRPELLHILQHSLGVDKYGQGNRYRNQFVTDQNRLCEELVSMGLMRNFGWNAATGGVNCHRVTDEGVVAMKMNSPEPPKLTRSQRNYRAYLRGDCGVSFGEWMKWKKEAV